MKYSNPYDTNRSQISNNTLGFIFVVIGLLVFSLMSVTLSNIKAESQKEFMVCVNLNESTLCQKLNQKEFNDHVNSISSNVNKKKDSKYRIKKNLNTAI